MSIAFTTFFDFTLKVHYTVKEKNGKSPLEGDFNVYYRNNIAIDKDSLFPSSDKYLQKKEFTIVLNFYYD